MKSTRFLLLTLFALFMLLMAACSDAADPAPVADSAESAPIADSAAGDEASATPSPVSPTNTPAPTATPTPTATPVPLAAVVNGTPITLATYDTALARYEKLGITLDPGEDIRVWVLEYLIEQSLIEQEAERRNITVADTLLDSAISETVEEAGGDAVFTAWLAENGFEDEASYREQVSAELLTQAVYAAFVDEVPRTTAVVRARIIMVETREVAEQIVVELANGGDFVTLLNLYSIEEGKEVNQGDLGYFERGTLFLPAIGAAAFELDAGATSDVIEEEWFDGSTRYFIVQTTDSSASRPIDSNRRAQLAATAFEAWLSEQREAATVDVQIGFD
jgi:foldase protein PrsA